MLPRAYEYASRDHALWMSDFHKAGDTGLARYFDLGEGPVDEMADDSTYYPDVIRWLLAHPDAHTDFLVSAPDSPDAAESLAMLLEFDDHTTKIAGDGPAALEAIETFKPDLILLDIGLPGMNGYQVAQKIRETHGNTITLIAIRA